MELLTNDDLEIINGGGNKEIYQAVCLFLTEVLTHNAYAGIVVSYAASEHYDYLVAEDKKSPFDPSTYQHPYRNLN